MWQQGRNLCQPPNRQREREDGVNWLTIHGPEREGQPKRIAIFSEMPNMLPKRERRKDKFQTAAPPPEKSFLGTEGAKAFPVTLTAPKRQISNQQQSENHDTLKGFRPSLRRSSCSNKQLGQFTKTMTGTSFEGYRHHTLHWNLRTVAQGEITMGFGQGSPLDVMLYMKIRSTRHVGSDLDAVHLLGVPKAGLWKQQVENPHCNSSRKWGILLHKRLKRPSLKIGSTIGMPCREVIRLTGVNPRAYLADLRWKMWASLVDICCLVPRGCLRLEHCHPAWRPQDNDCAGDRKPKYMIKPGSQHDMLNEKSNIRSYGQINEAHRRGM